MDTIRLEVNAREIATIKAALVYYANSQQGYPENRSQDSETLATDGGQFESLDDAETWTLYGSIVDQHAAHQAAGARENESPEDHAERTAEILDAIAELERVQAAYQSVQRDETPAPDFPTFRQWYTWVESAEVSSIDRAALEERQRQATARIYRALPTTGITFTVGAYLVSAGKSNGEPYAKYSRKEG